MSDKIKYCEKCLLPEWYLGNGKKIKMNNGTCELCGQEDDYYGGIPFAANENYLSEYLTHVKGQYEYDCIVLYTGGRDSTYTLQLLKEKFNLNILAVTWDNGFFADEQRENMDKVVRNIVVDHLYVNVEWDVLKAIYRNRLFKFGRFCNCVPLVFLFLAPLIIEKRAPAVVFSTSVAQTINVIRKMYGGNLSGEMYKQKLLERGISPISRLAEEMFDILCVDILTGEYDQKVIDQLTPFLDALKVMTKVDDIVSITPSCFFEWDERNIKKQLDKIGWSAMFDRGVYNHSSCLAEEIKAYLSYKQKQINLDVLELAHHKRSNRIGQSEYYTLLKDSGYCGEKPYYWETFLDRMDLTEHEMDEIVNSERAINLEAQINFNTAKSFGIENMEQLQEKMNAIIEERILI